MSESESEARLHLRALGEAVRVLRQQRALTCAQVAAAASVEAQRIEAIEAGELDPSYELLLALARGLGVAPAGLLGQVEELEREG